MFEDLIETAGTLANDEFVNRLKEVAKNTEESFNSLKEESTRYKSEFERAIEKRDKVKNIVKQSLGIEDVSEESLQEAISKLGTNDTKQLQELLNETKTQYEAKISDYEQKLRDKEINFAILQSGALDGVKSKVAKQLIIDELKAGATLKDGSLVYLDENESIIFGNDGKPVSVVDKVQSLYNNDDYKSFFPIKNGGGKQGDNGGYGAKDLSKLSRKEKAELMAKLSPAEYQKLVLANIKKK